MKLYIIGQDPYPNPEMRTEHAFEFTGPRMPGSFSNLMLATDNTYEASKSGSLKAWRDQGVVLVNACDKPDLVPGIPVLCLGAKAFKYVESLPHQSNIYYLPHPSAANRALWNLRDATIVFKVLSRDLDINFKL